MSKLALLLLPGLTCDERLWQHQVAEFGAERTITSFALLPEDSMEALAHKALARMPPGRFALAGLSMGGYLALEIVRQAPERVAGLALLDTSARNDTEEARSNRRRLMAQASAGPSGYAEAVSQLLPKLLHPDHLGDSALVNLVADMAAGVGADGFFRQQTAIMGRADSRPLLAHIACPTLVLCGRQDQLTPLVLHEELQAGIPGAHLVVVDQCGHMSTLEQPAQVNRALAQWLELADAAA